MRKLDLIRDVLDKQLVDRDGKKMGRVDGLVLELQDGEQPEVFGIELGAVVLARRVGPRAAAWMRALRRLSPLRTPEVYAIPWEKVLEITPQHVQVDVPLVKSPGFAWERWWCDHFVSRMPGEREANKTHVPHP